MTDDHDCDFCAALAADSFEVVVRGDLAALDTREVTELALVAQRADRALRQVLGAAVEGTNLVMSNGSVADQGVPHAHLHVTLRASGDGYEFREDTSRYPVAPLDPADRAAIAAHMRDG
ncbi:HIT family protein [Curtobacterium sp. YR515]|uniref:HIT family protein n=1 Tax=Curtobacterium sp. YR515 TaxID=1855316 RepID=UPI0008E82408|nr:HIT domain-containing protein [Curtobacterium sp. YR515]SFF73585.1 HIT domain-containing protein [Curtobacterium sp. YR515]